ncbi:MAG: transcription elongation factor Spt5 [Candidatus Micrarchaeia archaeon]
MLFAYRVTAGQESIVADLLYEKIKKQKLPVAALIMSTHLKGYLIAEASNEAEAKRAIMNVPHVKGMLKNTMKIDDIKELLESKPVEVILNKGDLVEVTSGPFKGERAKIVRIEKEKEKVTVELVEIAVPIPVTIKINSIKTIPK